jgi:transcriptional regulator with XRE-family HTH domain
MGEFQGIGEALKILRGKTGLKQREVGERAGVTPAMISTYETGKAIPLIPTVESLLQAMGFDRFDLLNAIETANGRPLRKFPEADGRNAGIQVLKALGVKDLSEPEREVYLNTLRSVCLTLQLARQAREPEKGPAPKAPDAASAGESG